MGMTRSTHTYSMCDEQEILWTFKQIAILLAGYYFYIWNITFTKINLVYALPPCYREFLGVQKRHGIPGIVYGDQSQNIINHYQFCGVRNVLHLYPWALDVEIIYKNNKVITESDFSFLFQVIDILLVKTETTNVIHIDRNVHDPTVIVVAGGTSNLDIFQLIVNKLSEITFIVTPDQEKYIFYAGPIVHEQFRVKSAGGSVKILWFQSTIVIYTKSTILEHDIDYVIVRSNLPVYSIKLEKDEIIAASFPNTKCTHGRLLYCRIKVSRLTMKLRYKLRNW